jgi:Leucine-rich repeat (LRR) protein
MSIARNIIRILNETDDDDDQVSLIIKSCSTKKCKSLDLSYQKLTEIPQEVFELENLEILNLSNNELSELPIEISRLKRLKRLNISYNDFEDLPYKQLKAMKHLELLCVTGHYIKDETIDKLRDIIGKWI